MPYLYNVGTCRICGSPRTGRVLPPEGLRSPRIEAKNAKKGIFVKLSSSYTDYNCFCFDCGTMWRGRIDRIKLTPEEYAEYLNSVQVAGETLESIESRESNILKSLAPPEKEKKHRVRKFLKGVFISPFSGLTSIASDVKDIMDQTKRIDYEEEEEKIKKSEETEG